MTEEEIKAHKEVDRIIQMGYIDESLRDMYVKKLLEQHNKSKPIYQKVTSTL